MISFFKAVSMKFLLVLAALVGLAFSFTYPSYEADHHEDILLHRERRYLRVNNDTVVNATTLAIGAFYFGTIALGFMSVLNNAANQVVKHRSKLRKDSDIQPSPLEYEEYSEYSDLEAYERYEQELREYKQAYAEYVKEYKQWAEEYGQDPNPPKKRYEFSYLDLPMRELGRLSTCQRFV